MLYTENAYLIETTEIQRKQINVEQKFWETVLYKVMKK